MRKSLPARFGLALTICSLLAACNEISRATIPDVALSDPLPLSSSATTPTAFFVKLASQIGPGEVYGRRESAGSCLSVHRLKWKGRLAAQVQDRLRATFVEESSDLGFKAVDPPESVFIDADEIAADYKVAATLKDVAMNYCVYRGGEVYLKLHWQVQDSRSRTIAYEGETEAVFELDDSNGNEWNELFVGAFREAVRQLLADPRYRDLLSQSV